MSEGKNTARMPSALMMGRMMALAPISSRAPITTRLGVGTGSRRRVTPKMATMKKCATRTKGRGLSPDSSEMGPCA
jgi:hypothetical protein